MDKLKELYNTDIKENFIKHLDDALLAILLTDKSTKKNLIWATDTYADYGLGYGRREYITQEKITGRRGGVIKPRIEKSKQEQKQRIKNKAEVFTPAWVCNVQNNLVDNAWFGRKNVFNTESGKSWTTNSEKIVFPDNADKTWKDYVKQNRMEIACGEAPYLTSRYDAVSGKRIELADRIGLLDRKLRIVGENTDGQAEWYEWATVAFKSVYGFDFQGDNVLIARENLLFAFIEAYADKFNAFPPNKYLTEIARILAWNIWQMDGLKLVVPYSCEPKHNPQISFFDESDPEKITCEGCLKNNIAKHAGIYCRIMNWDNGRSEKFLSQISRKK